MKHDGTDQVNITIMNTRWAVLFVCISHYVGTTRRAFKDLSPNTRIMLASEGNIGMPDHKYK